MGFLFLMASPEPQPMWDLESAAKVRLHPRVKIEWVGGALAGLGIFIIFDIGALGLTLVQGGDIGIVLGWTAVLAVLILAVILWVQFAYENYWYALLPEHLVVAKGVFIKTRTFIPYGRIQNVNVTRTVADRILGLSRVTVDTAGARFSEGVIPGIVDAQPIVAFLMGRAEEVRLGRARLAAAEDKDAAAFESIRQSLHDVLSALRPAAPPGGAPP